MDSYLNPYMYQDVIRQYWLRKREVCSQPKQKFQRVGVWRRMFDRPRAFLKSRITGRPRRVAPAPSLAEHTSEEEWLTRNGFSAEEIAALCRLKQCYHMGNAGDLVTLRHWEFLRRLVSDGKLVP